jgi:hypothetical protein
MPVPECGKIRGTELHVISRNFIVEAERTVDPYFPSWNLPEREYL